MTFHFEERILKNLETLLFHTEKLLRVIKIIQLPVREGDRLPNSRQFEIYLFNNIVQHNILSCSCDTTMSKMSNFDFLRKSQVILDVYIKVRRPPS